MRTYRLLVILGLVGVLSGAAEFNGQYENILNVNYAEDWQVLDQNVLLFSIQGDLGGASFLHADAEASLPFGSVQVNLLDYLPDSLADAIPDSLKPAYAYRMEPGFKLSNAYMSLSWSRLTARLGKQPLAWGTGYVWNPTEVMEPKLLYDPSYRRDGVNAAKVSLAWGRAGGVEVAGILKGTPDSLMGIARLKENVLGFDVAAVGGWLWDTTLTPATTRNRIMAGGQFAGEIGNVGMWAEGGYNVYEEDSLNYAEFVVGADHTFTFRTHLVAEYLYYGRGYDSAEDYTFDAWLQRAQGRRKAMGKHLLYLGADHPITFHSVSLGAVLNPLDVSGMLIPGFNLSLADNLSLSGFGFVSLGDEGTEFGGTGANGGILRLTGYF